MSDTLHFVEPTVGRVEVFIRYDDIRVVVDGVHEYWLDGRDFHLEDDAVRAEFFERFAQRLPFKLGDRIETPADAACLPDKAVLVDDYHRIHQVSDHDKYPGGGRRQFLEIADTAGWESAPLPSTVLYLVPKETES
jgi:hypothetical protein